MGGVKIQIDEHHSGYGYPHYQNLQAIPTELQGIDPTLWADFWAQVSNLQVQAGKWERLHYVGLVLSVVIVLVLVGMFGGDVAVLVLASLLVLLPFWLRDSMKPSFEGRMKKLCQEFQDPFRQQGFRVSHHVELSKPNFSGVQFPIHVVHFVQMLEDIAEEPAV